MTPEQHSDDTEPDHRRDPPSPRPAPVDSDDHRQLLKDVIKAQREAGKFQEGRGDIVFGIFGSGRAGRRIGTTVAVKVYGGEGHLIESPSATVMQFKSKEPHAAIIESRDHGVRNLKAAVKRAVGLTSMKRKYVEELRTKFGRT